MDYDLDILDVLGLLIVFGLVAGAATLVLFGDQTGPGNPHPAPPDANWTAERLNDTHVQIGHLGGTAVQADALVVTVNGTERAATWEGTVDRGTVGVLRAPAGTQVVLYWTGDPRAEQIEIGSWNV